MQSNFVALKSYLTVLSCSILQITSKLKQNVYTATLAAILTKSARMLLIILICNALCSITTKPTDKTIYKCPLFIRHLFFHTYAKNKFLTNAIRITLTRMRCHAFTLVIALVVHSLELDCRSNLFASRSYSAYRRTPAGTSPETQVAYQPRIL